MSVFKLLKKLKHIIFYIFAKKLVTNAKKCAIMITKSVI